MKKSLNIRKRGRVWPILLKETVLTILAGNMSMTVRAVLAPFLPVVSSLEILLQQQRQQQRDSRNHSEPEDHRVL